jgi:protease-4
MEKAELGFWWSDLDVRPDAWDNWGFGFGKTLGYTFQRNDFLYDEGGSLVPKRVFDQQIGFGKGTRGGVGGVAFGWSSGDSDLLDRKSFLSFGALTRPGRYVSYGTVLRTALGEEDVRLLVDLGIRPLGTPLLTVFGDYTTRTGQEWNHGDLEGGVAVRPVNGLDASFKLQPSGDYQFAVGVTVARFGLTALPRYSDDGDHVETHYVARANPATPGFDLDGQVNRDKRFLRMDLQGRLVYQKYRWWDSGSLALRELTERIEFARRDPTVGGILLSLSGLEGNPEMLWELRQKLEEFRAAGKKVVILADRLGLAGYYLASVADRLVLHPEGETLLPGIPAYRTYLKNTLAKLGIAYDEWRYFKYKSAAETLSRDSMSEADREQRLEVIQAFYDEMANGITASRHLSRAELDSVVNGEPLLYAPRMVELGLADAVGTRDEMARHCREAAGGKVALVSYEQLREMRWQPKDYWGAAPRVALVYAVGPTQMDEGISARKSARAMERFRKDPAVRAVVVRADSPGGDPLASDVFAHETRLLKKDKPVLVSQGRVAASGGYWISVDGSAIYTSPFSITGSIGVIGGWAWNDGLGEKLGLTSDHVQVGEHADLFGGLTLPLLGATIPERNLTPQERDMVKDAMLGLYDRFVAKVAQERRLPEERVREIAEGRIYAGRRAVDLRLADRVGTLDATILAARRAAGIPDDVEVEIVEYPRPPLFRWPSFMPKLPGILGFGSPDRGEPPPAASYSEVAFRQVLGSLGRPLVVTPSDLLPEEPLEELPLWR